MTKENFTLDDVISVKEKNEERLFAITGVTGVGTGYKIKDGKMTDQLSIVIYVAKKLPAEQLSEEESIPKEIDGIPTDVLEGIFSTQVYKTTYAAQFIDRNRHDPLIGGISLGPDIVLGGNVFVGTLGLVIQDRITNEVFLLSNLHVMSINNTGQRGDIMLQPSRVDSSNPSGNQAGRLERGALSDYVDAAISTTEFRASRVNYIAQIGIINGFSFSRETLVQKRGRTTSLTIGGYRADVNFTVQVNYPTGLRTFRNQIRILSSNRFCQRGDSGSVIVETKSGNVVGLLFASTQDGKTTIANHIRAVFQELNITI